MGIVETLAVVAATIAVAVLGHRAEVVVDRSVGSRAVK
jgi:hypothetical protein